MHIFVILQESRKTQERVSWQIRKIQMRIRHYISLVFQKFFLLFFLYDFFMKKCKMLAVSDLLKNYFSPKMTPEIRNTKKDEYGLPFLFSTKINFVKMAYSTVLHWPASFDSQYFGETGHSAELWLINPWPLYSESTGESCWSVYFDGTCGL